MDEQSKEMEKQKEVIRRKDAKIQELEYMLKANDTSQNMDYIHMQDDLNAKDTIISDLKYKLEDS